MMRERMLEIIYWKPPEVIDDIRKLRPSSNKDVIEAAISQTETGDVAVAARMCSNVALVVLPTIP
jgi:hypothetical protein